MKSLNDIKQDMSALYDELKSGAIDIKLASELANVAGKFLKAEQLDLATAIFLDGKPGNHSVGHTVQHQIEQH